MMRRLSPRGIPYEDWGGEGPVMHFAHANGFPPGTYRSFVAHLVNHYHVLGMECRALWGTLDPRSFRHWREMGEDLADFLADLQITSVIAVGHSLGAVTSLFCAADHPKLIRALVLVDPVILPAWFAPLWWVATLTHLNRQAPLAVRARRRRMTWPSRRVLLRAYRSASVFRKWQEPFLSDYVQSGTIEEAGGRVRLRYPREWEARIFETPPWDVWCVMRKLRNLPVLVIRGQDSNAYRRDAVRAMKWLLPAARFREIAGADHFVPMCSAEQTAAAILEWCEQSVP